MNKVLHGAFEDSSRIPNIIGQSVPILEMFKLVDRVASSSIPVLIQGEIGTGRELVAKEIHFKSRCANKIFLKINAIDLLVVNSYQELTKKVLNGCEEDDVSVGTIYFDEILDCPLITQKIVLYFIDKNEDKDACTKERNFRIILSTSKNIKNGIRNKDFSDALYYRINRFSISVPPLRDRQEDVMLLADYFLKHFNKEYFKNIHGFSRSSIEILNGYDWPGNVRELKSCIERAVLLCNNDNIMPEHLTSINPIPNRPRTGIGLVEQIEELEKKLIFNALSKCNGNQRQAAKELDITERMLGYKINKYKICKSCS